MSHSPLDLERLASRIEALQRASTTGWASGDDLEFRRKLPPKLGGEQTSWRLPDPGLLREAAQGCREVSLSNYQAWNRICSDLEGIEAYNRPNNPVRIMKDAARGKFPF